MSRSSETILNNSSENGYPCFVPDLRGDGFQFLTIENNVCWFVIYDLYHVEVGGSVVKNMPTSSGDVDSLPGSGRYPGEGNDNPLQYSCMGNPMDREGWQATVRVVTKELDTT